MTIIAERPAAQTVSDLRRRRDELSRVARVSQRAHYDACVTFASARIGEVFEGATALHFRADPDSEVVTLTVISPSGRVRVTVTVGAREPQVTGVGVSSGQVVALLDAAESLAEIPADSRATHLHFPHDPAAAPGTYSITIA